MAEAKFKNLVRIEIEMGENLYQFYCENNAPFDEARAALDFFKESVDRIEEDVKQKKEKEEQEVADKAEAVSLKKVRKKGKKVDDFICN